MRLTYCSGVLEGKVVIFLSTGLSQPAVVLGKVGIGGFLPKAIHSAKASPEINPVKEP